jgi:spoIIIJ-associated protein
MIDQNQIEKIIETTKEFFNKMTINASDIVVSFSSEKRSIKNLEGITGETVDVIDLNIKVEEPQILIGQQGQTLFEIQRLLRTILNKKITNNQNLVAIFYLNLDINDYKKQKVDYLKYIAKDSADKVSLTGEEKALLPMSSYERRIVHAELSQRTDIITESRGDGLERYIVIKPK